MAEVLPSPGGSHFPLGAGLAPLQPGRGTCHHRCSRQTQGHRRSEPQPRLWAPALVPSQSSGPTSTLTPDRSILTNSSTQDIHRREDTGYLISHVGASTGLFVFSIYLAASGLNCVIRDLSLWHTDSSCGARAPECTGFHCSTWALELQRAGLVAL